MSSSNHNSNNSNSSSSYSTTVPLMMSSVAAISASNAVAGTLNEDSNTTTTHCAENEAGTDASFPEDALFYDTYNGVTINVEKLPGNYTTCDISNKPNAEKFTSALKESLSNWKNNGKRGIWIQIPNKYSIVVPHCAELGFEFRHAKDGHLVMTKWLPDDQPSRLPLGPTHQLGVGVIIIHPLTKKMLVVQEKTGPAAARKLWKMPTGLTDPGEDIVDAAIRETKEETGLDVTFDRILSMRQAHGAGSFKQSDLFVVCQLKLSPRYDEELKETNDIKLHPQEEEIAMIQWMDVDEFSSQELWQSSPLYKEMNECINLAVQQEEVEETKSNYGLTAKTLPLGYRSGEQTVYLSSSL